MITERDPVPSRSRHDPHRLGSSSTGIEWWSLLDGFESENGVYQEDAKRLDAAQCVSLGMFYWDDLPTAIPTIGGLEETHLVHLIDSLEAPATDWRRGSLASSANMRRVRQQVLQRVFDALAEYADDQLATATVIKRTMHLTPEQLLRTSAPALKNQFLTDLKRTGVAAMAGPFVAFLHGEFEPSSRLYVIHWHVLTTADKGTALHRLRKLRGYEETHTGAAPIQVKPVKDRIRQFSYTLKAFWSQHPVRDGVRQRRPDRIGEPYHTLHLAWLDQQSLKDITIMNGVWSCRRGGTDLMKWLYLAVFGRAQTIASKRLRKGSEG